MRNLLVAIFAVALVAGCVVPSTGTLQLKVTDAAEDITSFNITIDKITAHLSEENVSTSENETFGNETNETEETGSWITVLDTAKTIDLVDVKDLYDVLGEAQLPVGKYTQIRVYVSSGSVTTTNGTYELTIPSGTIKFVRPFEIQENLTTSLVLDWDADKSVVFGEQTILKPVVRLSTEFTGIAKGDADRIREQQRTDAETRRAERGQAE